MTMLEPTQALGEGRQSPHSTGTILQHPPYSRDLAPSNYHLFGPIKEGLKGKNCVSDEEVKTALKNGRMNFEGRSLPLRETVTMLRSRNVIHRGPASF